MQEKPDGVGNFLKGDDCSVQVVKPQQCRDFTNLWNFPGFEQTCHAIPKLVGEEAYQRRITLIKSQGNDRVAR